MTGPNGPLFWFSSRGRGACRASVRPHFAIPRVSERHDDIQAVRRPAHEDRDQGLTFSCLRRPRPAPATSAPGPSRPSRLRSRERKTRRVNTGVYLLSKSGEPSTSDATTAGEAFLPSSPVAIASRVCGEASWPSSAFAIERSGPCLAIARRQRKRRATRPTQPRPRSSCARSPPWRPAMFPRHPGSLSAPSCVKRLPHVRDSLHRGPRIGDFSAHGADRAGGHLQAAISRARPTRLPRRTPASGTSSPSPRANRRRSS